MYVHTSTGAFLKLAVITLIVCLFAPRQQTFFSAAIFWWLEIIVYLTAGLQIITLNEQLLSVSTFGLPHARLKSKYEINV